MTIQRVRARFQVRCPVRRRGFAAVFAMASIGLLAIPADASRFATGMQIENWSDVDLDLSQNPKNNSDEKIGFSGLEFDVGPVVNYYLEEPGFIFSLISGMANTEANEVTARNEAIRKGEGTYTWEYAKPAPVPEGRWFRWGYSRAFADGATRTYKGRSLANGKDSMITLYDPKIRMRYLRLDMNIVTAPQMIGTSDFYWMMGADISGTSMKIYADGQQPGDDWSFMSTPFNLHLGWNPKVFPYLMLETHGGIDIIDPIANLFVGFKNYTPYSKLGLRATLGTDWISVYGDFSHQVDPLWDYGEYNRRYNGYWTVYGTRVDLGNLFMKLF